MKKLQEVKFEIFREQKAVCLEHLIFLIGEHEALDLIAERYADQFKTKWIPVSERLPELGEKVMVYSKSHPSRFMIDYRAQFGTLGTNWHYSGITHWMPLPSPPTK